MPGLFGMANTVEELPLYSEVLKFWDAVNAILQAPRLRSDHKLWKQISDANDSVEANLKEGFEQPSDGAFANMVFTAKGSVAEVIARTRQARRKNHITDEQLAQVIELGEPIGRMMGGFIKYLAATGFTDRGRHSVAPRPPKPTRPPNLRQPPKPGTDDSTTR
jgi:four helix bundle protein